MFDEIPHGVTLPSERGGDSIQAKPTSQTHPNFARLKQSLQPKSVCWPVLTWLSLVWLKKLAKLGIEREPNTLYMCTCGLIGRDINMNKPIIPCLY
jgi:hypothetical protein